MYLVDRIEWPSFFDLLEGIAAIRDELNRGEVKFISLVQKWTERNNNITTMCIFVIQLSCHQIEKIFDLLNKLQGFDDKQDSFQKRLTICFSMYIVENFDLFPCALKIIDKLKEKEEWKRELDEIFCERLNKVINETGHLLWAMTNEELVKVQLFYTTIRNDLVNIEAVAYSLITIQREVLNFDWLDDTAYNEWKDKFMSIEQMVEGDEAEDDEEEEDARVNVTLIADDEIKENPQVKVSLQLTGDDSSLSSLIATYSEELE